MHGSNANTKWYSQSERKITGKQKKAHSLSALTMLCAHNRVCPPEEGERGDSSRGGQRCALLNGELIVNEVSMEEARMRATAHAPHPRV